MGKNQHSKDLLHIRPTEWAQDGGGFRERGKNPFVKLPLHCCFLSLQPFEKPVGTRDGHVFEITHILPYIKKYGLNPINGARLEVPDLIPLHFHKNVESKFHCPVTFKVFSNNSHVVMNAVSGHIYSYEAVEELNKKTKNWSDLMTSQKFKWTDIVTIQDPDDLESRQISKFFFMVEGQQEEVTRTITHKKSKALEEESKESIRKNAALERIYEEKKRLAAEKAAADAEKAEEDKGEDPDAKKGQAPNADNRERKTHERYTDGMVAESFTSTATPLRYVNDLRKMTDQEDLEDIYNMVRMSKTRGYVRIITSEGMLNLELHTNIAPRTSDNFLRLCDKDYYNGTVFHRLIHNFMMQGGDPTNTGRGGRSAFEGGKAFRDEFDSRLSHQGPGIVSMANNGKNTNKSQFFITLKSCQHLDNKHSIFGRVVGGLQLLTVFNSWECDDKDRPRKDIKIIRTEVFKNPFKEAAIEAAKPKVEQKAVDPVATWFSNRRDPMEEHKNRHSTEVGKYMQQSLPPLPGEKKRKPEELPREEMEYAAVPQKSKRGRTEFDFSKF